MSPAGLIGVMSGRMKHLLDSTGGHRHSRRPKPPFPTLARCFNYPLYRHCASSPFGKISSYLLYTKLMVARV